MSGLSEFSVEAAKFGVTLAPCNPDVCAADGCHEPPIDVVTLAYCSCDAQPHDHGHPGSPDASRDEVPVCARHGALIAHFWESFERLQNLTDPAP